MSTASFDATPATGAGATRGTSFVLSWIGITLLAFPISGYFGWGIAGRVDGVGPALIGGGITGVGIGLAQWLKLRRAFNVTALWIPVTGVALAIGLATGGAAVGYETSAGSLAVMGAISGAAVGVGQGTLLRLTSSLWIAWIAAMPVLWVAGWLVSNAVGVDVSKQFTVFGASGSIAFGALSGLLLAAGSRRGLPKVPSS